MDAVAIWNPNLYKSINSLSEQQRLVFYSDLHSEISMLVGISSRIKENRSAYKRFLQAIKRAELFLTNHPDESKEIVIQHLKDSYVKNIINNTWDDFNAESALSNSMLNLLTLEADWMIEKSQFTRSQTPDFVTYIDETLMQEIDPLSVTLQTKNP